MTSMNGDSAARTEQIVVRTTSKADWSALRSIRLEMLRDSPIAYAERLMDAEQRDQPEWEIRAGRGAQVLSTLVAAIDASGHWVGTMGAYVDDGKPVLVGVYVSPTHRGRVDVTDAMLERMYAWARTHGDRLWLEVHEDNSRAIAAYRRRGFAPTGRTRPYRLGPDRSEIEMVKRI